MKKIFLISPAIFFIADRIIKYFAPSISVEGGFVKFGFYKNYAGAFSLPIAGNLYDIAGIILLIFFIYLFFKEFIAPRANCLLPTAYCFILLGGLSNMFDRLAFGYTIDYVNFMNFSFFNIADAMLLAGIFILLFFQFKKRYEK